MRSSCEPVPEVIPIGKRPNKELRVWMRDEDIINGSMACMNRNTSSTMKCNVYNQIINAFRYWI
jgi:hypothetical protein